MKILQVKKYHEQIAQNKWFHNKNLPKSAFFFMLEDNRGYPTENRVKGYVAFDNIGACFGINKDKAIIKFKKSRG